MSHEGDLRCIKQEVDTWATHVVVNPAFLFSFQDPIDRKKGNNVFRPTETFRKWRKITEMAQLALSFFTSCYVSRLLLANKQNGGRKEKESVSKWVKKNHATRFFKVKSRNPMMMMGRYKFNGVWANQKEKREIKLMPHNKSLRPYIGRSRLKKTSLEDCNKRDWEKFKR